MIKIFLALFLTFCFVEASSIDKKIQQNKKQLDNTKQEEETKNVKIKELADKIESQNNNISNIENDIKEVNIDNLFINFESERKDGGFGSTGTH